MLLKQISCVIGIQITFIMHEVIDLLTRPESRSRLPCICLHPRAIKHDLIEWSSCHLSPPLRIFNDIKFGYIKPSSKKYKKITKLKYFFQIFHYMKINEIWKVAKFSLLYLPFTFHGFFFFFKFQVPMSFGWSLNDVVTQGNKRSKMSHHVPTITSWDINDSLAADFDGSLSGLGSELGTTSYNMR